MPFLVHVACNYLRHCSFISGYVFSVEEMIDGPDSGSEHQIMSVSSLQAEIYGVHEQQGIGSACANAPNNKPQVQSV